MTFFATYRPQCFLLSFLLLSKSLVVFQDRFAESNRHPSASPAIPLYAPTANCHFPSAGRCREATNSHLIIYVTGQYMRVMPMGDEFFVFIVPICLIAMESPVKKLPPAVLTNCFICRSPHCLESFPSSPFTSMYCNYFCIHQVAVMSYWADN